MGSLDQHFQDQRRVGQSLHAAARDLRDLADRTGAHAGDDGQQVAGLGRRQGEVVDDVQRPVDLIQQHPCDRPPRAAEGVEIAPGHVVQPGLVGQARPDLHGGPFAAAGALQQPEMAQRIGRAAAELAAVELDQVEAAAAEIAEQAVGLRHAAEHAPRRELGLLGAVDDIDRDTEAALHLGHEVGSVGRLADRRRRHQFEPVDVHGAGQQGRTGPAPAGRTRRPPGPAARYRKGCVPARTAPFR